MQVEDLDENKISSEDSKNCQAWISVPLWQKDARIIQTWTGHHDHVWVWEDIIEIVEYDHGWVWPKIGDIVGGGPRV